MISNNNHRNTRQRKVILEELQKVKEHPTAASLYAIVRRRMPKISLGTVYRNLELLNQMGMVQKLDFSGAEARYDGNVEDHDHLRCVRCMRVDDAPGPPLALAGGGKEDWGGYKVLGHRLEVFGVCPKCSRRKAK
jgi:Fe2+ or Zn2+ uptake regulation protein